MKQPIGMNRRALLTSSLASGLFVARRAPAATISPVIGTPVADTASGKVRGIAREGVQIFRGIPYGASTSGQNRFMPPQKPQSWSGVRDAYQNGHSAMQIPVPASPIGAGLRANPLLGEDCLVLNVFTPSLNDGKKRPVMFWIHGGGYNYSSGTTLCADGTNLARTADVVVVCVNHRLNIFGYLFLGNAGKKYATSGNNGQLDLVAALEWVRDNAAHFGGDPGNVTIFGQSGGGGKVATLMAMPAAEGLFHRAIIESGSTLKELTADEAQQNTDKFLAALRMKLSQAEELKTLPTDKLLAAMKGVRLGPVVDGVALPRHPFEPTAPEISADVPMMVGTTDTEGTYDAPELVTISEQEMHAKLRKRLGPDSEKVIALFRKTRPHATPAELYFTIFACPVKAHLQAERKAALGKGPAYLYMINWRSPVRDGLFLSPHCLELPFVFQNVWHMPEMVGTGPEIQPLADKISGAWVAFARAGNPNHSGIPHWPAFSASQQPTMVINNEWTVVNDLNREERDYIAANYPELPPW